jgi:hypothetical protein
MSSRSRLRTIRAFRCAVTVTVRVGMARLTKAASPRNYAAVDGLGVVWRHNRSPWPMTDRAWRANRSVRTINPTPNQPMEAALRSSRSGARINRPWSRPKLIARSDRGASEARRRARERLFYFRAVR